MTEYAVPDVLVGTEWVAKHLDDGNVRLVESNEDVLLYMSGHVPGAVNIDWINDLNDTVVRDYISTRRFAEVCAAHGIGPDTLVVFYGDKSNWWACYAFWVFKLFGHARCAVMNGGRAKWIAEGRPMTKDKPSYPVTNYPPPPERDQTVRAFRDAVLAHSKAGKAMVDVRSPQEFSGERTHMPEYPQESVLRGGHIPGALNCPWSRAAGPDGAFKSREELEAIYQGELKLDPAADTIAYCRIGERSSHTWFVLKYLLGFENVRNYDGSWTEWGNMVGMPIEKTYVAEG